jgi:hypothetical protein
MATYTCDPDKGEIRRVRAFGARFPAGSLAGNLNKHPRKEYLIVSVGGHFYLAHRLIWLYVHGAWPSANLDHRNGVKTDNRISNLRECTVSENAMNTKRSTNNKSGFKGVHFHKASSSWCVHIQKLKKQYQVVGFDSKALAGEFSSMLRSFLHGDFSHD